MNAYKWDRFWTIISYLLVVLVACVLGFMLYKIFLNGWGFWDWQFLTKASSTSEAGGGIGLQLFNSFYLLILTLCISIPISLGAGIYLAEYAKNGKGTDFIRLCIETLASLPSIVVGLFGLLVLVTFTGWGYTLFAGALVLTILNLPGLTRVFETALRDVPRSTMEGGLALGATKWQTILTIAIPSAIPQLVTGVILTTGRIFGEAAALIYTAGLTTQNFNMTAPLTSPMNPFNIFRPAETLAVHIWKLNSEGIVPDAGIIAAKSAAIIVVMVFLFNILARFLSSVLHKHFTGISQMKRKREKASLPISNLKKDA